MDLPSDSANDTALASALGKSNIPVALQACLSDDPSPNLYPTRLLRTGLPSEASFSGLLGGVVVAIGDVFESQVFDVDWKRIHGRRTLGS